MIKSLEETAAFFGLSTPTMKRLVQQDGFPIVEKGSNGRAYKLDLRAVKAWMDAEEEQREQMEAERAALDDQLRLELLGPDQLPDGAGEVRLSPKARADALKAELAKVQLARMRRELVSAEEMQFRIIDLFKMIRDRLRLLPEELARELGLDDDATNTALGLVDDFLNDLADKFEDLTEEDTDDAAA